MEEKIRKNQYILMYSGYGVIVFSFWSIVKYLFLMFMDRYNLLKALNISEEYTSIIKDFPEDIPMEEIILAVILVMLLIDIAIRIYLGRSAIREGQGRKINKLYLLLAIIYVIINSFNSIRAFFSKRPQVGSLMTLSSNIVDFSAMIFLIILIIASLKLRIMDRMNKDFKLERLY